LSTSATALMASMPPGCRSSRTAALDEEEKSTEPRPSASNRVHPEVPGMRNGHHLASALPVRAAVNTAISAGQIGATGFEPATFRPPAERIQVSMCLGASVVSYVSSAVDDLDR
jgi:hypothetical protein